MKHLSLASRYRPQKFSEVIGQHLATSALSRAAAEDRVAPAYLLSGTRGVGKTTIARIFAKALNCAHAPAAEPCNECSRCLQITNGNHVDVNEIDGASNTGVDDVRALRENIGYMPMDGRYKIFIVDEAHMLSKNAFNALLKTLEEPPAHTVFIFATTEAHRFPATIISRCQHFVFRHLPEQTIFDHLCNILKKEDIGFEDGAVRLLAARAAGSVRDSLSLLDQVLSLCAGTLDAETARASLGLAGREFFEELFAALAGRSCPKVVDLCRQLLLSGVDIGFFTRELASYLRNLFLYRQVGEAILPSLTAAPDESAFLKKHAPGFSAMHLHAAWQMTLASQRGIAQNPEPGSALELLLINLALLPSLLPVENMADVPPAPPPSASPPATPAGPARSEEEKTTEQPEKSGMQSPRNIESGQMPTWKGFCEFCRQEQDRGEETMTRDILSPLSASFEGDTLKITAPNQILWQKLEKKRPVLLRALERYLGGKAPELVCGEPPKTLTEAERLEECAKMPEVQLCQKILDATLASCAPRKA